MCFIVKRTVMKNNIQEPDNLQGKFENALRRLNEKLDHFHCPVCHAEEGITFFDDPYYVMHYDWNKSTTPWTIQEKGYGKTSVLGVCNNCGYTMLFNVDVVSPAYKRIIVREQREVIAAIAEETIEKKQKKSDKNAPDKKK